MRLKYIDINFITDVCRICVHFEATNTLLVLYYGTSGASSSSFQAPVLEKCFDSQFVYCLSDTSSHILGQQLATEDYENKQDQDLPQDEEKLYNDPGTLDR